MGEARRFLIASGTHSYRNESDWTLESVPQDLLTIGGLFTDARCGYTQVLSEVATNPDSAALLTSLRSWFTSDARTPEDVAVLYYSGHGDVVGDTFYLMTSDTRADDYDGTAVDVRRIVNALLQKRGVRRLLIIIDACYSGDGVHKIVDAVAKNDRLLRFDAGEGIWVLAAARPREEAQEAKFAEAFQYAVKYWQANTGERQEYLSPDAIFDSVARRLGPTQRPYDGHVGPSGLPPFFPNPRYQPDLPPNVDLDTRRKVVRLERDLNEHWLHKARGFDIAALGGWYFTGRRSALHDLSRFAARLDDAPTIAVVTGNPGSGKSAVLGRLVLHGIEESLVPERPDVADLDLFPVQIDAAMVARGKTAGELWAELDAQCPDESRGPAAITPPRIIVLDALDEAIDPDEVIDEFVARLYRSITRAGNGDRLIVGTRRHLIRSLPGPAYVVDLDDSYYLEPADPADYAAKILLGLDDAVSTSPYRDTPELARAVAHEIGQIAGASFLIAQRAAATLAAEPTTRGVEEIRQNRNRWRDLAATFERDLERYGPDAKRVRDLLAALAWSEGAGLPRELWPTVSNAVSEDTAYDDGEVAWLLERAGSYIVEALEHERSVYRLYHKEFVEYFQRDADARRIQSSITQALLASVRPVLGSRRNWSTASPYLHAHLAVHAAAGGMLGPLLADLGFLVHAEPERMRGAMQAIDDRRGIDSATTETYLATVHALVDQSAQERASQLEFTARGLGHLVFAERIVAEFPDRPLTTRWTRWPPTDTHLTLNAQPIPVRSLAVGTIDDQPAVAVGGSAGTAAWNLATFSSARSALSNQRTIAVDRLEDRLTALIPVGDVAVQLVDVATGVPIGVPLRTEDTATGQVGDGHFDDWCAALGTAGGRQIVAVSSPDGLVSIWDVTDGRPTDPVRFHEHPQAEYANRVSVLALGTVAGRAMLASGTHDGIVRRWDPATGAQIGPPLTGHRGQVRTVHFACAEGRDVLVTAAQRGGVTIFDLSDETRPRHKTSALRPDRMLPQSSGEAALCVAVNSDGSTLVAGYIDSTVRVWNLAERREPPRVLSGHSGPVRAVALATLRDHEVTISAGSDGTVRVWDLADSQPSRRPVRPVPTDTGRQLAASEMNGEAILVSGGTDGYLRRWRASTGEQLGTGTLPRHGERITALVTGRCGNQPVAATAGTDGFVRLWDVGTGAPAGPPIRSPGYDPALALASPNGRDILLVFADDRLQRWDPTTGTLLSERVTDESDPPMSVGGHPSDLRLLVGQVAGAVHYSGLDTELQFLGGLGGLATTGLAVGYVGGRTLGAVGNMWGRINVVDLDRRGQPVADLTMPGTDWSVGLAFGRFGSHPMLASSRDRNLWLWDPQNWDHGPEVRIDLRTQIAEICFTVDGSLAVATDGGLTVFGPV